MFLELANICQYNAFKLNLAPFFLLLATFFITFKFKISLNPDKCANSVEYNISYKPDYLCADSVEFLWIWQFSLDLAIFSGLE